MAKKIPNTTGDLTNYIKTDYMNSMVVNDTNESELINIVNELNLSNSIGRDGLSSSIIKATIFETCGPLSMVFNKSLTSGKFPDAQKVAKIVPIHKADKKLISNYRPISVLLSFLKYWRNLCIADYLIILIPIIF